MIMIMIMISFLNGPYWKGRFKELALDSDCVPWLFFLYLDVSNEVQDMVVEVVI